MLAWYGPLVRGAGFDSAPGRSASCAVLTELPVHLLLAQAMIEHGLLDSIAAGVGNVRYRLELYIGEGNTLYFLAAAVVLLVLTRVRRRR